MLAAADVTLRSKPDGIRRRPGGARLAADDPAKASPAPDRRPSGLRGKSGSGGLSECQAGGGILINSSLESSVPLVRRSVEQLGLRQQRIPGFRAIS
jgi:hypothetical protein